MLILETRELSHRFGDNGIALDNVGLEVPEGSIYGFLGPNGAGKTTTLRLILGLLKKQQGSIAVFGKQFDKHRVEILRRVGSLIESPSLYGHLTAVENLTLLQKIHQCPKTRIDEVLDFAGLAGTGNKKASQFSLGMRQRLAIAVALLHSPSLLILDEPTNGLDPNGIIEIREMLQHLHEETGTTILVSSHLLSEIERLVTHVGIINNGRMMFQGTLDDLKRKQQQSLSVVLETSDVDATRQILGSNGLAASFEDGKFVMPALPKDRVAKLNHQLVAAGIEVFEISVIKNDLESIFIDIINN
jgi:ABC-2 type transport system ATP-binding protein